MNKLHQFLIVLLALVLTTACQKDNQFISPYLPKNAPAVEQFLLPLPPGAVKPEGWIKTRAEDAAAGLTGTLCDYAEPFSLGGWQNDNMAPERTPFTAWWPYEQNGYYHDGYVRLAHVLQDSSLLNKYSDLIKAVLQRNRDGYFYKKNSVQEDGTLFDHYKLWAQGSDSTDFHQWRISGHSGIHWSHGTFLRSVLAHYKATGDERLLDLFEDYFEHYPTFTRMPEDAKYVGAEMLWDLKLVVLESALEVYAAGRDSSILHKIETIAKGYESGMVKSWARENDTEGTIITHGVAFQEIAKMYALFYFYTGNEEYLKTTLNAFDRIEKDHMQPHGVYSSGEFLRGTGAFQFTETCNVAGWLWTNVWMARILGDAKYGDKIEKIFFNAEPGAISPDYKTHVYFQAPNRFPDVHLGYDIIDSKNVKSYFKDSHIPKCCSGNLTRILPNYVMHQWMATVDGGLAAFLYGPSTVQAVVNGGEKVEIECETQYPFSEKLDFRIKTNEEALFPLYFRIPDWCEGFQLSLNGETLENLIIENGFVKIERKWNARDLISLTLPMEVEVNEGVEKELTLNGKHVFLVDYPQQEKYHSDYKLTERGKYAYVQRGPLVFSFGVEDTDGHNQVKEKPDFNIALNWDRQNPSSSFEVKINGIDKNWRWSYNNPPVEITANVQEFDWSDFKNNNPSLPLESIKVIPANQKTVTLIPYGCAKFRMTMFPVVE